MSDAEAGLPVARLRPEPLLQALVIAGVEFVIIGGFSLAAHGIVRATKGAGRPARAGASPPP